MDALPGRNAENGTRFTASAFLEAGAERLRLSLVAGEGSLGRTMAEPIVNRPGLALTGFYRCFAWRRLQMVGNAECAYLHSLGPEGREASLRGLLDRKAWLFVFTGGNKAQPADIALAEEYGAVILETPLETRVFSKLATFVLERLGAPRIAIYGTMVEVCGLGVLFEGAPGLGKSETALGLIKRGCALVADDLACIRKDVATNLLFGSASEATAGYMEIRGIGLVHVPSIFGVDSVRGEKRLQLVVTFKRLDEMRGEIDRIGQTRKPRRILGVDVPNVVIPVSEGRDLVNLVETAAQQHKVASSGCDVVSMLSGRLKARADVARAAAGPADGRKKEERRWRKG